MTYIKVTHKINKVSAIWKFDGEVFRFIRDIRGYSSVKCGVRIDSLMTRPDTWEYDVMTEADLMLEML
jgi:hypothetical protein